MRCFKLILYFKVPAESSKCSVEESMGEKGSACSARLQQVGRTESNFCPTAASFWV